MERVVVRLRGGLGNQLFCYAAARSLSRNPLVLSYGGYFDASHPTVVDVGVRAAYPNRLHRSRWPGVAARETWRDDVSILLAHAAGVVSGTELIRQESDPFAPRVPVSARAVVLDGWFQHPDWWRSSWRDVACEIASRAPAGVREFRETDPVVVKVRRSDYLQNGWELDAGWLRKALGMLSIRDCEVIVASEDPEAAAFAAPILDEAGCRMVSAPAFTGNPNIDDFWATTAARRLVLANSSYCWWAGAVAQVSGDVDVACPEPWLPNPWSSGPLPSMLLPGWITVPARFPRAGESPISA